MNADPPAPGRRRRPHLGRQRTVPTQPSYRRVSVGCAHQWLSHRPPAHAVVTRHPSATRAIGAAADATFRYDRSVVFGPLSPRREAPAACRWRRACPHEASSPDSA